MVQFQFSIMEVICNVRYPYFIIANHMEIIVLAILISTLQSSHIISSLQYDREESTLNSYRLLVVQNNLDLIRKHNQDPTQTYSLKANPKFIGYTEEEIKSKFLIPIFPKVVEKNLTVESVRLEQIVSEPVNNSILFDLRNYASTPVWSQGIVCKNAYAYVTVDMINMLGVIKKLNRPLLSPQQVTDCSSFGSLPKQYRNSGCYNGLLNNSLYYLQYYGAVSIQTYPINTNLLQTGQNQSCRAIIRNGNYSKVYTISSWRELQPNNPNERATALVNRKPVASYIATGGIKFFLYKKGIINECKDTTLDHAVLIVGFSYNQIYGKYWIIKNTLGMSWGDDGYGHISMSNDCGLLKHGYIASL